MLYTLGTSSNIYLVFHFQTAAEKLSQKLGETGLKVSNAVGFLNFESKIPCKPKHI